MPRRAPPPQTGRLLFFLYLLMMTVAVAEPPCPPPPPGSPCAPPCAPHSTNQCLHYLQESHKHEVCNQNMPPGRRRDLFAALRLRHCCEHRVDRALPEAAFRGGKQCHRHLQNLLQLDEDAAFASCTHTDLLKRYDCTQNYSIAHDCQHCKVAYRRWICSELIPHYVRHLATGVKPMKGGAGASPSPLQPREFLVRPCPSVCQRVEEQCPYLVPDQTLTPAEMAHPTPQYAGEPTFLCLDLNIPRLEQRNSNSTSGQEDCCYTHCGTPGRGTTTDKGGGTYQPTEVILSYARQAREHLSTLEICEHCPGRPADSSTDPLTDTPTDGASAATASSAASAIVLRTNNNNTFVFYAMLLLLTQTRKFHITDLFKCLIKVMRASNHCCSSDKRRTVPNYVAEEC